MLIMGYAFIASFVYTHISRTVIKAGSCVSGNEEPNYFNGQLRDYYCLKKATSWS